MSVVDDSFDHPLKVEEGACAPLAGGIMQYGYQCGMLWGAALAAGAQAYQLYGPGPQAEMGAMMATQRLVASFQTQNKHINCSDITEVEWKPSSKRDLAMQMLRFFAKGGPIGCFRMAAAYAPIAYDEINSTLSQEHIEAPSSPVSCTAMLAKKMGASDLHTVMAAGFAGGIGLCGGGCGALGAAIWIAVMNSSKEGAGLKDFENPEAVELIDRFLQCTDYEFECSEIVGRKFQNIQDHSGYVCNGGCSEIFDVLAIS
ncbi:MAG: hypothetical protein DWQ04_29575 [Chloroflexi bacterium]|nr:MAG: hypothetical protein DWQ04_29575 [Chloroflexota bacterium]